MSIAQPVVGVLALQGDVREHLLALAEQDVVARPVRRPEELAEVHGLVLPGGESTTMSRLLDTFELLEPLRDRVAEGLPVYGSCAGMILLASEVLDGREGQHTLGAIDMVVRRNAFGRQVDSFEADLDFAGLGPGGHEGTAPLRAVFIRAPWVESLGDRVEVLARVPETPAAGPAAGRVVAVRQGNALATAFHPELLAVDGRDGRVHELFVRTVREA
nr:pyridoxal 5'-phosphate synthase glutaminase subunit PdxT [Actinoalloteichus spitiensis]